jgi:hypothetical protein
MLAVPSHCEKPALRAGRHRGQVAETFRISQQYRRESFGAAWTAA